MDPQFQELSRELSETITKAVTASVEKRLDDFEKRLVVRVDDATKELKHQAELHREALRQDVRAVADGYAATLEGIERELVELNEKVDKKFVDHDLVLSDHNERLVKLEKR